MSSPRRPRATRGDGISEAAWRLLLDAKMPDGTDPFWAVFFEEPQPDLTELWKIHGDDVLQAWIGQRPGTRPTLWWHISAPEPQRRRLGGTGTTAHECLAMGLGLHLGAPTTWLTPELAAYYRSEGPFPWPAFDMDDPPIYESQATYLDRHGLLTAAERKQLADAAFEPEPPTFPG